MNDFEKVNYLLKEYNFCHEGCTAFEGFRPVYYNKI